jgi:hypothetical protein
LLPKSKAFSEEVHDGCSTAELTLAMFRRTLAAWQRNSLPT